MSDRHITLLGILLVAICLRWWGIGQASYWYDEFGSLETSAANRQAHFDIPKGVVLAEPPDLLSLKHSRPAWKIWTSMDQDFHPPLYFILLRLWRELFGSSEAATRSLSALAGVLTVLCICDVGRLAHGWTAGLWAAAICAVAGPQVVYAQETRGYTLVVLFGVCVLDAIVRIEVLGINWRRLLALAASTLAMMLTHYLGGMVGLALGMYLLIQLRGKMRWQAAGAMVMAAVIFAVIWGPFIPAQRQVGASDEKGFLAEGTWTPWYSIEHVASLPIELLGPPVEKQIASTWPSAIVYVLPLLLFRKNRFLLLWFFWLIGAMGLFAVLDQIHRTHHFSFTRYIVMCGPGFYLIFAGLLAGISPSPGTPGEGGGEGSLRMQNDECRMQNGPHPNPLPEYRERGRRRAATWMPHALPALAVLFCLISLPSSFAERRWPDWRAISAAIDQIRKPGDVLVFASDGNHDWFSGEYMSYAFTPGNGRGMW